MKITFNPIGNYFDCGGFSQAGCTFHQQVAVTEKSNKKPLHQPLLTNNKFIGGNTQRLERCMGTVFQFN